MSNPFEPPKDIELPPELSGWAKPAEVAAPTAKRLQPEVELPPELSGWYEESTKKLLEVSDPYQNMIRNVLKTSKDPAADMDKLISSAYLSQRVGIPMDQVFINHDAISQAYYGSVRPVKSNIQAVKDRWVASTLDQKIGMAGFQQMLNLARGIEDPDLQAQMDLWDKQRPTDDILMRGWGVEVFKSVAQMAPYMWENFKRSAPIAASAATIAAATVGLASGPGAVGTIPATWISWFSRGMQIGSAVYTFQAEAGLNYTQLVKSGIPREIAAWASIPVGIVNAAWENFQLANIPGWSALKGKILNKFTGKVVEGTILDGTIAKITREATDTAKPNLLSKYLKTVAKEYVIKGLVVEPTTEVFQEVSNIVSEAISKAWVEMGADPSVKKMVKDDLLLPKIFNPENAKRLAETYKQTAQSMLIMGLGGVAGGGARMGAGAVVQAVQKRAEKAVAEAPPAATTITPPAEGVVRTPAGGLNIQVNVLATTPNGVQQEWLAGDPAAGARYGHATFTATSNKVTIDELVTENPDQDVRKELFLEVAKANAGKEIEWSPTDAEGLELKDELIVTNPQKDGTLQWYKEAPAAGAPITPAATTVRGTFVERMGTTFGAKTPAEAEVFGGAMDLFASHRGMTTEEAILTFITPEMVVDTPEAAEFLKSNRALAATRFSIGGEKVTAQEARAAGQKNIGIVKAAFTALKGADIHVGLHELMHAISVLALTDADIARAEKFLGPMEAWDVGDKWEILANGWEDFLATGTAPTAELVPFFAKVTAILKSIVGFIAHVDARHGVETLSPEFKEFFNALLTAPESAAAAIPPVVREQTFAEQIDEYYGYGPPATELPGRVIGPPTWERLTREDPGMPPEKKLQLMVVEAPAVEESRLEELPDIGQAVEELFGPATYVAPYYAPVGDVEVSRMVLSPDVPNFKRGANAKGIIEELKGLVFIREPAYPVVLWERIKPKAPGQLEIITGRHRIDLGQRLGEKSIPAQIMREADGFTPAMAMTFDAEANIRDGHGEIEDYVAYFRNSDITIEDAQARGLLDTDKGRKGFAIGRYATDDLFSLFANGVISTEKAAAIGSAARGHEGLTALALKAWGKNKSLEAALLSNYIDIARSRLEHPDAYSDRPGKQGTLEGMGEADIADDLAIAAEAVKMQNSLKVEQNTLKMAEKLGKKDRAALLAQYGIAVGDTAAVVQRIAALEEEIFQWKTWMQDPVKHEMMREAAGLVGKAALLHPGEDFELVGEKFIRKEIRKEKVKQELFFFGKMTAVEFADDQQQMKMFEDAKVEEATAEMTPTVSLPRKQNPDLVNVPPIIVEHEDGEVVPIPTGELFHRQIDEETRNEHERAIAGYQKLIDEPVPASHAAQHFKELNDARYKKTIAVLKDSRSNSVGMIFEGEINSNLFAVVVPSARTVSKWAIYRLDANGPMAHELYNSHVRAINALLDYGFILSSKTSLPFDPSAQRFRRKGMDEGWQKEHAPGDSALFHRDEGLQKVFNDVAVQKWGTTTNMKQVGWLLSDGRFLDWAPTAQDEYRGRKMHVSISEVFTAVNYPGWDMQQGAYVGGFKAGAIRVDLWRAALVLQSTMTPTPAQWDAITTHVFPVVREDICTELMTDDNRNRAYGMFTDDYWGQVEKFYKKNPDPAPPIPVPKPGWLFHPDYKTARTFDPATVEERDELVNRAVVLFGITEKKDEAGFILHDGRLLDLSDGRGDGKRHLDHRAILKIMERGAELEDFASYGEEGLNEFLYKTDSVRMHSDTGHDHHVYHAVGMPNEVVMAKMGEIVEGAGQVSVVISAPRSDGRVIDSKNLLGPTAAKLAEFFKNALEPDGDNGWLFHPDDVLEKDFNARALEEFSVTKDQHNCRWILSTGEMLDFYDPVRQAQIIARHPEYGIKVADWVEGHYAIEKAIARMSGPISKTTSTGAYAVAWRAGALRLDYSDTYTVLQSAKIPTDAQKETIMAWLPEVQTIHLEVMGGEFMQKSLGYRRFRRPTGQNLDDFYNAFELYAPEKEALFHPEDELTNNPASIKAVEPWLHKSLQVVNDKIKNPMPASRVLKTFINEGVKEDELKWDGLDDYLKGLGETMVTPGELLDFIAKNAVQVVEQDLKNSHFGRWTLAGGSEYTERLFVLPYVDPMMSELIDAARRVPVPGGEQRLAEVEIELGRVATEIGQLWFNDPQRSEAGLERQRFLLNRRVLLEAEMDTLTQRTPIVVGPKYTRVGPFTEGHFQQVPNVIAHARFKSRLTGISGDYKSVLALEEIQSDWHQKGRRSGYSGQRAVAFSAATQRLIDEVRNLGVTYPVNEISMKVIQEAGGSAELANRWYEAMRNDQFGPALDKVPAGPFQKTWHELAMKRMIKVAVDKGYDYLAWTPGSVQNERYNLSKFVDEIRVSKFADGGLQLTAHKKGSAVLRKTISNFSELTDYVGQKISGEAQTALEGQRNGTKVFTGQDMTIGGEGMIGFYDDILVRWANKYGKQWGVRVEDIVVSSLTAIPKFEIIESSGVFWAEWPNFTTGIGIADGSPQFPTRNELENWLADNLKEITVEQTFHAIKITEEMKAGVKARGQNLFHPDFETGEDRVLWDKMIDEAAKYETAEEYMADQEALYGAGTLKESDKENYRKLWEAAQAPPVAPVEVPKGIPSPTRAEAIYDHGEKIAAAAEIKSDPVVAEKVDSGEITPPELEGFDSKKGNEEAALRQRMVEAQAKIDEILSQFTPEEQYILMLADELSTIQKNEARTKRMQAKIRSLNGRLDTALRKNTKLAVLLTDEVENAKLDAGIQKLIADERVRLEKLEGVEARENLRATTADAIQKIKENAADRLRNTKAKMWAARRAALAALKVKMRDIERERKAIAKLKVIRGKLIDAIMVPVSRIVEYLGYADEIQDIQDSLDPKKRMQKTLDQRAASRAFFDRNPELAALVTEEKLEVMYKVPMQDMSMRQLEEIHEIVDMLRKLGKLKRSLVLGQDRRAKIEMRGRLANTVLRGAEQEEVVGSGKKTRGALSLLMKSWKPGRIAMLLDGAFTGIKEHGVFWQILQGDVNRSWGRMQQAIDSRTEKVLTTMKENRATMDKLDPNRARGWEYLGARMDIVTPEYADGFRYSDGNKPTNTQVMYWYLGMKNPLTAAAILHGNKIPANVVLQGIAQLSKASIAVADAISADMDLNFPRLRQAFIDAFNFDLKRESNYVPMERLQVSYDSREDRVVAELTGRNGNRQQFVARHPTYERLTHIKDEHQKPINTELFSVWMEGVQVQEGFIHQDKMIKDMHSILESDQVVAAVNQKFGPDMNRWLKDYTNDLSQAEAYKVQKGMERWSRMARSNAAIAWLSFNILSAGKQVWSSVNYLADAGPFYLTAAGAKFLAGKGKSLLKGKILDNTLVDWVESKSELVKHRSPTQELQDLKRSDPNTYMQVVKKIGSVGMKMLEVLDKTACVIGWTAVYDKVFAATKDDAAAVEAADDATVRTQPSMRVQDMAEIYRVGETMKWFTMFTSDLNQTWNRLSFDVPAAIVNGQILQAAADLLSFAVTGVGIALVSGALHGEDPDKKKRMMTFSIFSQLIESIPILGNDMWSVLSGRKFMSGGVKFWPAISYFEKAPASFRKAVETGDWGPAVQNIMEGLAFGFGLPVVGPRRAAQAFTRGDWEALLGWPAEKK